MRRRRHLLLLLLASLPAGAQPAAAQPAPAIDQSAGSVAFAVGYLGFLEANGRFDRFAGRFRFDPADPAHSQLVLTLEAGSIQVAPASALGLLRSPAYFDVASHPAIGFATTAITAAGPPGRFRIAGALTIRGITQPLMLDARLDGAEVTATGQLSRADYGMLADRPAVADTVTLTVRLRLPETRRPQER